MFVCVCAYYRCFVCVGVVVCASCTHTHDRVLSNSNAGTVYDGWLPHSCPNFTGQSTLAINRTHGQLHIYGITSMYACCWCALCCSPLTPKTPRLWLLPGRAKRRFLSQPCGCTACNCCTCDEVACSTHVSCGASCGGVCAVRFCCPWWCWAHEHGERAVCFDSTA